MNSNGIVWSIPPENIARGISQYGERLLVAVVAVANYVGMKMQNEVRQEARWEDRTGAARSGLFFAVDAPGIMQMVGQLGPNANIALAKKTDTVRISGNANTISVYLGHTVFYGKYLELSNGGRYAVILSTMQRNIPVLESMLTRLVRRFQ